MRLDIICLARLSSDPQSTAHPLNNEHHQSTPPRTSRSLFFGLFLTVSFMLLWPILMGASSYVFSVLFFTGRVAFLLIWAFLEAGVIFFLPIGEGITEITIVAKRIFGRRVKERSTQTSSS